MDAMGETTVREWLSRACTDCAVILGAGMLISFGIAAIEYRLLRRTADESDTDQKHDRL